MFKSVSVRRLPDQEGGCDMPSGIGFRLYQVFCERSYSGYVEVAIVAVPLLYMAKMHFPDWDEATVRSKLSDDVIADDMIDIAKAIDNVITLSR